MIRRTPGTPGTPPIPSTPGYKGKVTIQTGANSGDHFRMELSYVTPAALGIDRLLASDPHGITKLDGALETINAERAKYGIYQNILQYRYNLLATMNLYHQSTVSRIEDADMAKEIVQHIRLKLIQNIGTKVLSKEMDAIRDRIVVLLNYDRPPEHKQPTQHSVTT